MITFISKTFIILFLALFVRIIFYPCEGIGIFSSIYSIISLYQCIKSFIYISIIIWVVIQYYLICCSNFSSFGSWELFQFSPVFLPLLILSVCVCVCVCVCVSSSFLHFFHHKMLQTHLRNYISPKISHSSKELWLLLFGEYYQKLRSGGNIILKIDLKQILEKNAKI